MKYSVNKLTKSIMRASRAYEDSWLTDDECWSVAYDIVHQGIDTLEGVKSFVLRYCDNHPFMCLGDAKIISNLIEL